MTAKEIVLKRMQSGLEEYHKSVRAMGVLELFDHCFEDGDIDPSDFCVKELRARLEIVADGFDRTFALVNAAQTLLENLEETHAALCFTSDYIGSLRYNQNKAAIALAKGDTI